MRTNFAGQIGENIRGVTGRRRITRLFCPSLLPCRRGYCVDQNERNPTGLSAVVDPSVVSALLDEDIACGHMDLAVIHEHVDLAVQNNRVVHTSSSVGIGVPKIALRRWINPHRRENLMMIDMGTGSCGRGHRRKLNDTED